MRINPDNILSNVLAMTADIAVTADELNCDHQVLSKYRLVVHQVSVYYSTQNKNVRCTQKFYDTFSTVLNKS